MADPIPPPTVAGCIDVSDTIACATNANYTCLVALPAGGFAAGNSRGVVHVFRGDGGLGAELCAHTEEVKSVAVNARGSIVAASRDRTLSVWRPTHGGVGFELSATLRGHRSAVNAVTFHPLTGDVVSGSADRAIRVWDPVTATAHTVLAGHAGAVSAVVVLPTGEVVSGSLDCTVKFWDQGRCVSTLSLPSTVTCMALLYGGRVAAGGGNLRVGFVNVWKGGDLAAEFEEPRMVTSIAPFREDFVYGTGLRTVIVNGHDSVASVCWGPLEGRLLVALPTGAVLALSRNNMVFLRLYRGRLALIHVMVSAWALHEGRPPTPPVEPCRLASLCHMLSLRRLCRPRAVEGSTEVVEPFARCVVGFL